MEFIKLIQEYELIIDSIYGLYLDAGHGFVLNHIEMVNNQKKALDEKGLSIEHQDAKPIIYGVSLNNDRKMSYELHQTLQKDYKARNSRNGSNYQAMANFCLVQIYSYWEDHFRGNIAKSLNKGIENVTSDVLGDIRNLRESIVHHRSIATKKVNKNKKITLLKEGDEINFDEYQMESIIMLLKEDLLMLLHKFSDEIKSPA